MKRKYVAVILAAMMALSLTACGSRAGDTTATESAAAEETTASGEAETVAEEKTESTEAAASGEAEETADQSTASSEVQEITKDGVYLGNLYLPNEGAEDISGNIYDVAINDGKLTLTGELVYSTDESGLYGEDKDSYAAGNYSFSLAQDVTYTERGGEEDVDLSQEDFLQAYQDIQDSGLVLIITVENGQVTALAFSS